MSNLTGPGIEPKILTTTPVPILSLPLQTAKSCELELRKEGHGFDSSPTCYHSMVPDATVLTQVSRLLAFLFANNAVVTVVQAAVLPDVADRQQRF